MPTQNEKENVNHVNSFPENTNAEADLRSVLSPIKPVNLLPQVPINSNSYRKLSENEEHDCEIIGMCFKSFIIILLCVCVCVFQSV